MSNGKPRFNSRAERARFAVRKRYISDDDWTNKEIAEELNVTPQVVSDYLQHSDHAKEVQRARDAIETEEWRQMVVDLQDRIDRLNRLENQLWDVVEPVVTGYELVPTEAEIDNFNLQDGGNSVKLDMDEDNAPVTEVEIPIPAQWNEVPEFSRLRRVWDERRKTEEQLSKILGLEADDTVNVEGEITERKVFSVDDDYPDVEPRQVGEDSESTGEDQEDSNEEGQQEDSGEEDESN